MKIEIPELCLVMLVGASGSGKSTFARKHFLPTEVISSDYCRAVLADDENDQSVTTEAFDLLRTIAGKRLKLGRIAVVDATNVQSMARKGLIALARDHNVFVVAVVFDLPEKVLLERHAQRTDRDFGHHVIRNQRLDLNRSIRGMEREGVRFVHVLKTAEQAESVELSRTKLWPNRKEDHGPFDIVGDVHGCLDELTELLSRLGYAVGRTDGQFSLGHPEGRKVIFVGDLVDRGPDSPGVVALVRAAVESGTALCVAGNHDVKLARSLNGKDVKVTHGLERSLAQMAGKSDSEKSEAAGFLNGLISHYVLDDGRLVVAHAGLSEELQGRSSGKVRSFAMYGETTGETDDFGLPVRYEWARDYRGKAMVAYGHTPVAKAEWLNNTICLDTGCVFGGRLTALRYPERELVSVEAKAVHYEPIRPLVPVTSGLTAQQRADDLLDIDDVSGRRFVRTRLNGTVQVREENASAALEIMSRFAANPKWLIYLPPTMSPSDTSIEPGLLEHPKEAFDYYRKHDISNVICEEKHMGSRAVIVLCKDGLAAERRFGMTGEGRGIVHTRTGRPFFNDQVLARAFLEKLGAGIDQSGLWEELDTDWVCLDCELMPWSVKAMDLVKGQYAAVAASGENSLCVAEGLLGDAVRQGRDVAGLLQHTAARHQALRAYRESYRRYCWDVKGLEDIRLAPFHVLATEGRTYMDADHAWHLATIGKLARALPGFVIATPFKSVDLADQASTNDAVQWWLDLTAQGGEGMVVKPASFIARGRKGILQPAIKCRGAEYLRIIYGPEYLMPANLERLRERGLTGKRNLALKEFALGIEALERFVRKEPLRQVHECVFAVLALESEPIDPRL